MVKRHSSKDFAILGINTDDNPEKFRSNCKKFGVNWDNIYNGSTKGGLPEAWGVHSYPTMYVLDRNGVVRAVNPRSEDLERAVDALMQKDS